MKMKVLLTGASGLLGRAVLSKFSESKFEIVGTGFSRVAPPLLKLDLLDSKAVESFITEHKPQIIIHSAAERRPEVVQENFETSKQLNVGSTELLASLCAKNDIYLIYISTDYVFDGDNAPYSVEDKPNPLNRYGELKLAGEECVKNTEGLKWCVLRVPVLYGKTDKLNDSAVTVLYEALLKSIESKQIAKMNHIEKRHPTYCPDVAKFLLEICERYQFSGSIFGLMHFTGREQMTKYEMVQRMAKLMNKSTDFIEAETKVSSAVKRPYDTRLSVQKSLDVNLPCANTPFDTAIMEVLKEF